eukprot:14422904-Alexandrium_andersonii.AAC.1
MSCFHGQSSNIAEVVARVEPDRATDCNAVGALCNTCLRGRFAGFPSGLGAFALAASGTVPSGRGQDHGLAKE